MDINVIDYEALINHIKECNEKTALNISISKYLKLVHNYDKNDFTLISEIIEIIIKLDSEIMKRSTLGWEVDVNIDISKAASQIHKVRARFSRCGGMPKYKK